MATEKKTPTTIRVLGPNVHGQFCIYDEGGRGAWDGHKWRTIGRPKGYADWRKAWADASKLVAADEAETSVNQ